jgi:HAD superfamily hydrolase (TIGR01549 family)
MPHLDAVLLDYGNTIVEFDRPQIDFVRSRLADALSGRIAPTPLGEVTRALDLVCYLPFSGDPPEYREVSPFEQMRILLREVYGDHPKVDTTAIEESNEILQDLFVRAIRIDPAALEFLERFSRRTRVGLVSNYPCPNALRRSLRETGVDAFLDPIVISGDLGWVKPHRDCFRPAVEALGIEPGRILFVGDRWDADMIGARDMGMRTCHHVGFTSDLDLTERYTRYTPDHRIRRLDEIEDIVLGAAEGSERLAAARP